MKRFQSKLPAVTRRQLQISLLATEGYWYCVLGDHVCEKIEGEQGQPDHCSRCGSHRLQWFAPALAPQRQAAA